MIRFIFYTLILGTVVFGCNTKKSASEEQTETEWVSLFNGQDLEGWTVKVAGFEPGENFGNTFRVDSGMIRVQYDQYDSFNNKFGALYYNQKFSNYRLRVEYRFVGETTPGAPEWGFRDSGVQYHCQSPTSLNLNQPFPVCLEYNLLGGNGVDERPTGEICANGIIVHVNGKPNESYCTPPTTNRTFHGDQWVTLEIDVKGDTIRHLVNGEEVLLFTNPRYNPEHELAKTQIAGDDTRVREGYISLQSNSHPIDFRKIEILEYKD